MSTLLKLYPGGHVVEFVVVVLLAVLVLCGAALVGTRWLKHNPAARHWVLLSALICVVLSPTIAAALAWTVFRPL